MIVSTVSKFKDWGYESFEVLIDGKSKFYMGIADDCPEDHTFGRDLSDVFDIPVMLALAYDAGVRGESFTVLPHTRIEDED
jgi:hypothetical protein